MSARELITEHLDLWTGAVTKKSSSGRGSNGKIELTGIKKLRELILELALSGKLVEAEGSDKPAHQLLSKIESEKARLAAEKIIKKPKKLEAANDDEPYQIPSNWCWVRLGHVTNYGVTEKAEPNQVPENTWVLELEDIEKDSSRLLKKVRYTERQFKSSKNRFGRGDVLYGKLRPYLDKVLVADESGVCTTEIIPIRGYLGLLPEFLRLVLKSPNFKRYANDSTHGMNLPRMGTDKARLALIPLAPEQEQQRIVQKVDELMALCDRLEQQTSDQIEAHETLVDTLLGTLTQSETATELADNWARLAAHFDTLFTTEQSIDKLKQTILQLAVMGRLVEQDAGDESTHRLFDRVYSEDGNKRCRLLGQNQITWDSPLPSGWDYAVLPEVTEDKKYSLKRGPFGSALKKAFFKTSGFKVYEQQHAIKDDFSRGEYYVDEEKFTELKAFEVKPGDLIISCSGTVGRVAEAPIWMEPGIINQALLKLSLDQRLLKNNYFKILFPAFFLETDTLQNLQGTAQKNMVSMDTLKKEAFPMPPIEEQQRILQKVDELMNLCERLKVRLNQANDTRCKLAEAVVDKAVN